jgi:hypothetical protein
MCGLPQPRPNENDQSSVEISPTAPALRARSIRAAISSRVPTQYIWKNVLPDPGSLALTCGHAPPDLALELYVSG